MIKKMLIFLGLFVASGVGYIAYLQMDKDSPDEVMNSASLEEVSAKIELGKALYYTHCASCHGDNLQGQPKWKTSLDEDGHNYAPPLNGTGHTWHHSEEQLYNIIRYGLKFYNENYDGKMQGNDKLSDEDVWSILEYVKSVWPESIQKKYKTMTKH